MKKYNLFKDRISTKVAIVASYIFTGLLAITFVVLRLFNILSWSWFWILSPIIFILGLNIVILILAIVILLIAAVIDK